MGRGGDYRLNIPALSGGLNVGNDPTLIEDNELVDTRNLRWKDGALVTRKALRAVGNAPLSSLDGNTDYAMGDAFESITPHPFEIDGEMCVVVVDQVNFINSETGNATSNRRALRVVTLDGVVKRTYQIYGQGGNINTLHPLVVVPCDKEAYNCDFLVYHGRYIYRPDDTTGEIAVLGNDELYAPLVMVNGHSYAMGSVGAAAFNGAANGVLYEGFNMLTRRFRCRFTGGSSEGYLVEFYCLPTDISGGVTIEGTTDHGYFKVEVPEKGTATFTLRSAEGAYQDYTVFCDNDNKRVQITPSLPASTASDNIEITATAAEAPDETIRGATLATWFGGTNNRLGGTRLFLAGFADRPSKVMWSDVNNPLYFPENNYMYVGDLSQKITALEKQEDMLVIFKERELYYTTYVQGSIDEEAVTEGTNVDVTVSQAYFPLTQLSPYIGCDCPHTIAVCRNRLVWLCADGRLYTLATAAQYSERNVREIGGKIYPRLQSDTTAADRKAASAADYDGCYCLLIGKTMYLFEYSDTGFVNMSAYASGEKAAKAIAWYVYTFDGLPSYAQHRLLSDGAHKALVLSTCHFHSAGVMRCENAFVRVAYVFTDSDTDAYMHLENAGLGSVNSSVTDSPIASSLTTKAYDFGDLAAFKRIKALFLAAKGQAWVSFIADSEAGSPRRYTSPTMGVHLVMPGVKRCQTVAVRIESDTPLAVRGLRVQYQPFGTVR